MFPAPADDTSRCRSACRPRTPPRTFRRAARENARCGLFVASARLLTLPAFCTVRFVRRSAWAESVWLAFWTGGLVAMLVHLHLAMGALFDWNWPHILRDTVRVTIPIPDLVLTLWWAIDVALGWIRRRSASALVHAQRVLLHAALRVVFLIGFIREGETLVSRGIGVAAALAVVAAVIAQWTRRRTASPLPAHAGIELTRRAVRAR